MMAPTNLAAVRITLGALTLYTGKPGWCVLVSD